MRTTPAWTRTSPAGGPAARRPRLRELDWTISDRIAAAAACVALLAASSRPNGPRRSPSRAPDFTMAMRPSHQNWLVGDSAAPSRAAAIASDATRARLVVMAHTKLPPPRTGAGTPRFGQGAQCGSQGNVRLSRAELALATMCARWQKRFNRGSHPPAARQCAGPTHGDAVGRRPRRRRELLELWEHEQRRQRAGRRTQAGSRSPRCSPSEVAIATAQEGLRVVSGL